MIIIKVTNDVISQEMTLLVHLLQYQLHVHLSENPIPILEIKGSND